MKHHLAICAIVKNEHDYLLEWIAYHRVVGVERFLIYNNSEKSDDGTTKLLRKLNRAGLIELIAWPDRPSWDLPSGVQVRPQAPAYHDGVGRLRGEAEWVAFIDVDEFIVPMQEKDLPSSLKRYERFGGVGPNWRMFGSAGLQKKENVPVIKRFTMASCRQNVHNHHVKSIVRPELIRDVGTHRPVLKKGILVDEHGREITDKRGIHHSVSYDFLRINHYFTKSYEEWLQKAGRGRAATPGKRKEDFFYQVDFNDEEDTFILKFYGATLQEMRELASCAKIRNYPPLAKNPAQKSSRAIKATAGSESISARQRERFIDARLIGGFANKMIEYMVVRAIAAQVQDCEICSVVLSEWGINHPPRMGGGEAVDVPGAPHHLDLGKIVQLLSSSDKIRVNFRYYAQDLSFFPPLEQCRDIFPAEEHKYPGYGIEYLVCNVRGGEVLDARNKQYVLLPIEFYAELAETTKLKLVFVGQIEDNAYCRALRQRFPGAEFHPTRGALADFQTFRNSKNLVPSVSTFSWLAAWLSQAQRIFFPVNGLFHPMQEPNVKLLPFVDERYQFYLFPINYAVPVNQFGRAHDAILRAGGWRPVDRDVLSEMQSSAPRMPLDSLLRLFDEEFYLRTYKDIARAVREGGLESGRKHFITHGFREGRDPFAFDHVWYVTEYPMAALEVGRGDYASLVHHYLEVGLERGYKPVPDHTEANTTAEPAKTHTTEVLAHPGGSLARHVQEAFTGALAGKGEIEPGVLEMSGMSGRKYRLFINNLVRAIENPRYLEVGSWQGSSMCSAVNRNRVAAAAIDNWSEFGGPKDRFLANVNRFKSAEASVTLIENDFRKVDYTAIGRFNIYLFDGPHREVDQYDGIVMAQPALDREFILIVDDWNFSRVREGTFKAIQTLNLEICYSLELRTTLDGSHSTWANQASDWHNGYFIAAVARP